MLCAKWKAKGTECSGTIYRADLSPRAGPCALTLRKRVRLLADLSASERTLPAGKGERD